jgi:flagellin-like protein
MKMKNLRKCKKAVSPVISVLLMIAVAVAASLITYAWVMGYLGNTTGKVGKAIQIQSVANDTTRLYVYVQNVGDGVVTPDSLYVNGIKEPESSAAISGNGTALQKGQTATLTVTFPAELPHAWNPPSILTIKVVCTDGTFIEATQITLPTS